MNRLRRCFAAMLRWSWFGLLVMAAFAYLAAGLSEPSKRLEDRDNEDAPPEPRGSHLVAEPYRELQPALEVIDGCWADTLAMQGLQPAEPADWLTVCRRLSFSLVGSGMSLEEIRHLERLPESVRVSQHLRQLLSDARFHHYWAERWARFLVGTEGGEFVVYRRRRFRVWLAKQLAANRRYDQIARDLITAEGLWTDRPEVNFLTATFDSNDGQPDPIRLAARTSRVFLGLRIDCLQCHDDFLGNVNLGSRQQPRAGLQSDFHQLAAFYTSASTSGLQGVKEASQADYQYKYLYDDEEVDVQPAVPFQSHLLPDEGTPRYRLATWITHPDNKQAARAAVSHVWGLMFGRPAGESVDNLPLDEPSQPIMQALADDFVQHGYDLRRLICLIAFSSAYRVDSRASFEVTPEHERYFAVFPLVRLRPEQVAGSVIQACRIKKIDRESSLIVQLQTLAGTNDFVGQYGDRGEGELASDNVTITQRLLMMNGDMLGEVTEYNPILNATAHIDMFAERDELAVVIVYLCALNRYPTEEELTHFTQRFAGAEERSEAIEDLFWILLNSSEFAWNH